MRNLPRLEGRRWGLVLAAFAIVGVACSGSKVTTQTSAELSHYQIRTIALMPFTTLATPQVRDTADTYLSTPQSVKGSDISLGVPPNVESPLKQTATVPSYAADKVTQLFWSRLKNREGLTVLSPTQSAKAAIRAAEDTEKTVPERHAADVAATLKADAALMGQVLVYQERSGGRLGANPPASVGFEVKVVAPDGQVLWVGNYYERQQPMIQDIVGYIQHGGVFVTAQELAEYGVDKVLKTFPFGTGE
ncbi:MAG TPA: hypothetical protein VL261_05695 [Nitrospira sp.]|nr:hypothetical protein [Nitrospira sp.]